MNSGDGEQKKKKEEERGRGKQTGWLLWRCCWWRWQRFLLCLFAFLLLPVYVLPLLCFFFYFCRWWCCGGRGWWRCGGCSSSLLCFFFLFVLFGFSPLFFLSIRLCFFSFFSVTQRILPLPSSSLSPGIYKEEKRERGLLPLSSRGTGVGRPGWPLCNSLRAARGACPLCFSPHGRPWVRA